MTSGDRYAIFTGKSRLTNDYSLHRYAYYEATLTEKISMKIKNNKKTEFLRKKNKQTNNKKQKQQLHFTSLS